MLNASHALSLRVLLFSSVAARTRCVMLDSATALIDAEGRRMPVGGKLIIGRRSLRGGVE